jgi:hypothetical protein
LNKAIALYPEFAEAYRQRASVRIKLNEVDAALKDIKIAQNLEMDEENELQHIAVL